MELITFKITGATPLLLHSDKFANPLDKMTKAHKELTGKRKKTDDDHLAIMKSEWMGSLYYDPDMGVYVPGQNIEASLVGAAKLQKLGTAFKRGVMILTDNCVLQYKGPKSPEALYGDGDTPFVDIRGVRVGMAKLMRCRPKFPEWSLQFEIAYNPDVINKEDILKAVNDAGKMIGLCDYRPRFGRFVAEEVK